MITELILFISRFVILIAIQVAVLNNIQFSGFVNPFLYISFIMILPVRIPKALLLIIAFVTGLLIDVFTDTMGMHAAACILMAYVRPSLLKLMAPREGYEAESYPSVRELGFTWFLIYASALTFIHHLLLFNIEVFRFSEFFTTLFRVLLSSFATILLIMISQYLFGKATRSR